jgi:hypothetical protein
MNPRMVAAAAVHGEVTDVRAVDEVPDAEVPHDD